MLGDKEEHVLELMELPLKWFNNVEALQEGIQQKPLFGGDYDTVVCYSVDLKLLDLKLLKASKKQIILLMETIDKRSALYKHCNKKGAKGKSNVRQSDGTGWKFILGEYGLMENEYLVNHFRNNNIGVAQARLYCKQLSSLDNITEDSIKLVLGNSVEDEIFKCLEYLLKGNAMFFKLYEDLLYLRESEFKMMILLNSQLNVILKLYSYRNEDVNAIMSKTGLNYYQVQNNVAIAKQHSLTTLLRWYNQTIELEKGIRLGKQDQKLGWENLITNIMEGTR
jgi:hypothetical protein